MAGAAALAIPLPVVEAPIGVTEVINAMALGKAVIMTRNPYIDFDVDAAGCGLIVEPGDVDGWETALRHLDHEPDQAAEMGRRARTAADAGLNYASFCEGLASIMQSVLSETASGAGANAGR